MNCKPQLQCFFYFAGMLHQFKHMDGSINDETMCLNCRLTVLFLAFDVFFIIFCIGTACIIFFAIFCCIPILAIAYAVAIRRGASEEDIRSLPKYRYCQENQLRALDNDRKGELLEERAGSSKTSAANELALLPEDSVSIYALFFLLAFVIFVHVSYVDVHGIC